MESIVFCKDQIEVLNMLSKKEIGNVLSRILEWLESMEVEGSGPIYNDVGLTRIEKLAFHTLWSINHLQMEIKCLEDPHGYGG